MQAILCLRTAGPNAVNKHHPLPFCQASSVLRRRHCQLALNFSPLSCNGLWAAAGPSRRLTNMGVHSHMIHQEDGFDRNKADESISAIEKLAAAAGVLASTLRVKCMPGFGSIDEKSIQALREIFDRKCHIGSKKSAPTPKILLDILKDELLEDDLKKLKEYLDQLENIEEREAATNSLFEEWKKGEKHEAYTLGLVLIDLLINQGDYRRADIVCEKIEKDASESDVRPRIRRVILEMVLLADAMGSEVKEAELAVRTFIEFIELIQGSLGPSGPPQDT